jgi:AmmeMemoRadiSam system protein A
MTVSSFYQTTMSEPYLSEEQQVELFHAVGRRLASIVTNTRGARIADQVPDIAEIPLLGAFVSLKKEGELRSCMGTMSDQMPLATAVEQATVSAATDDPRFPPINAAELFELYLEIWLLWGMKRVAQRGMDRLNAVEIGKHGVQIARGGNRGLLLPGVAVDYDMDVQTFWEAVCRKAGLPTDAWLDDRSLLHTFEGVAIRGPVSATENIDEKTAAEIKFIEKYEHQSTAPPMMTPDDLAGVQRVCADTFQAMADGISPPGYFPGLIDGIVSGVSLSFKLPNRPVLICSAVSVRPDVPFQSTLIELLQALGEQVNKFGATIVEIMNAKIDVTVLWDPVIHGNANRHDVRLVDSTYRSVMVSSQQGWVVRFNSAKGVEALLKDAVDHLCLDDLDMADVISFETVSTSSDVMLSSVSKPNRGAEVRPSAIAGAFYPADVKKMNEELDRMFAD